MQSHSQFSDPSHNPNFRRRWHDEPLDERGIQHLGREVMPKVLEETGRRAIARWLDQAAQTQGRRAFEAFRHANNIRQRLGLAWTDLIDHRSAA